MESNKRIYLKFGLVGNQNPEIICGWDGANIYHIRNVFQKIELRHPWRFWSLSWHPRRPQIPWSHHVVIEEGIVGKRVESKILRSSLCSPTTQTNCLNIDALTPHKVVRIKRSPGLFHSLWLHPFWVVKVRQHMDIYWLYNLPIILIYLYI